MPQNTVLHLSRAGGSHLHVEQGHQSNPRSLDALLYVLRGKLAMNDNDKEQIDKKSKLLSAFMSASFCIHYGLSLPNLIKFAVSGRFSQDIPSILVNSRANDILNSGCMTIALAVITAGAIWRFKHHPATVTVTATATTTLAALALVMK